MARQKNRTHAKMERTALWRVGVKSNSGLRREIEREKQAADEARRRDEAHRLRLIQQQLQKT